MPGAARRYRPRVRSISQASRLRIGSSTRPRASRSRSIPNRGSDSSGRYTRPRPRAPPPAAPEVLADVANEVGQLERDAEVDGVRLEDVPAHVGVPPAEDGQ